MFTLQVIPHVYPTMAAAQAVASVLTLQEDEGWTYTVTADPCQPDTGKAIIMVADETGFVMGPL